MIGVISIIYCTLVSKFQVIRGVVHFQRFYRQIVSLLVIQKWRVVWALLRFCTQMGSHEWCALIVRTWHVICIRNFTCNMGVKTADLATSSNKLPPTTYNINWSWLLVEKQCTCYANKDVIWSVSLNLHWCDELTNLRLPASLDNYRMIIAVSNDSIAIWQ